MSFMPVGWSVRVRMPICDVIKQTKRGGIGLAGQLEAGALCSGCMRIVVGLPGANNE